MQGMKKGSVGLSAFTVIVHKYLALALVQHSRCILLFSFLLNFNKIMQLS